jgi:hypothetical protein
MTISHPDGIALKPERAFVFARLHDISCSICAPPTWTREDVEAMANSVMGCDGWQAIDKSEFGLGAKTPNPCNQDVARLHWFLWRGP